MNKKFIFVIILTFQFLNVIFSQNYPQISELKSSNFLFSQYQDEILIANKNSSLEKPNTVNFYEYTAKNTDTIFTISSRCCILYDTIATINNIEESMQNLEGKTIILPTVQGLFIPENPKTNLEIILYKEFQNVLETNNTQKYIIHNQTYFFLPGKKFTPAQRAYFVNTGMKLPLEKSIITSSFGMRESPITGKWKFHNGIDMAAPLGTPVFACKNGTVQEIGLLDPTYGNYIILKHTNSMTSFYAHLDEILVVKKQEIKSGQTIGKVGTTGASTGPHLHFELRINGQATNPESSFR